MSYQSGDLDTTLVNGEQVDQVKDDPEFQSIGAGYLWYVTSNIKDVKELANLNVRKAMTMAIDREAVTKDVLKMVPHQLIQQYHHSSQQVLMVPTTPKTRRNTAMYVNMMQNCSRLLGKRFRGIRRERG